MRTTEQTNLRTLTETEIRGIYRDQIDGDEWTFSDEREHMENLLCQRINFLLLVYSLIVTGLATAQNDHLFLYILISGLIVLALMSMGLWRACSKFLVICDICYRIKNHPIYIVNRENNARGFLFRGFGVNHLLGYCLPFICTASLVFVLVGYFCFGIRSR